MAYTRQWSDLVTMAKPFVKQAPTSVIEIEACDFVSSMMASAVDFKEQVQTIPSGLLPLVDSQQDYNVPPNIFRLLRARIARLDTSPVQFRELNVQQSLAPDLTVRSWQGIEAIALEPGVGRLRLSAAVQVPSGTSFEIQGEYQINPIKITNTGLGCWFDDKYGAVALDGLLHYFYKVTDDARAGDIQTDGKGRVTYTGQLGKFHAGLWNMRVSEDWANNEQFSPVDVMGVTRNDFTPNIYGV